VEPEVRPHSRPAITITEPGVDGMISRWSWHFACLAALVSTAAAQGTSLVTVHVLIDGENCIVYTQQMRCDAVGAYLPDDRHLAFSQSISVTADGTGDHSRAQAPKTAKYLATVGYSKVLVVGFLTEPGATSSTSS
jgi:hypothetical protein